MYGFPRTDRGSSNTFDKQYLPVKVLNYNTNARKNCMKTLVVYSTRTGNTKLVADAIAAELSADIFSVDEAPADVSAYDFVVVGYWVDRGLPNKESREYLEKLTNARIGIFGTLGAFPHSPHARDCIRQAADLCSQAEKKNAVLVNWMCQGKVDPVLIEMMAKMAPQVHPMTPERIALLEEASKHPDDADLASARAVFGAAAKSPMFK